MTGLALRYAARSDVGLVRAGNEDSGYAGPSMLVVADGMGGHAAGELASAAAVATFAAIDERLATEESPDVLAELSAGVARTTEQIREVVSDRPQLSGMGTTLTVLAWRNGLLNLVHVGDSRAYLLRDGELQQITHDHTFVQMLVDTERITPEDALTHPRRNLLMRAIDGVTDVEPDVQAREARAGDRYLLCSDGLSGVVAHDELARLLGTGDPTYAVSVLVEAALAEGAPDNITAVVADVIASEEPGAFANSAPVVVGAASETRNRQRLSSLEFPADVEPALSAEGIEAPPQDPSDTPAPRRRWWPVVAVLLAVAAITALASAFALWASSQYYVGTDGGYVVVYRGLPQTILGRPLSTVYEASAVQVTALPEVDRSTVEQGIPATDLSAARSKVASLAAQASRCTASANRDPGCPPVSTPATP